MEEHIKNTFMTMIVDKMTDTLDLMSDKEKIQLIKYCRKLKEDNCGWIDYALRKIVKKCALLSITDKKRIPKKYRL